MTCVDSPLKWAELQSNRLTASVDQFWGAVDIYVKRPHIINRRLIGGEILGLITVQDDQQVENIINIVSTFEDKDNIQEFMKDKHCISDINPYEHRKVAVIKTVVPKNSNLPPSFEVVVKDYAESHVSFINVGLNNNIVPCFPYAFSYNNNVLKLWVKEGVKEMDTSCQWIISKLVPKLVKWMERVVEEKSSGQVSSLRLVTVTEYSTLYGKMKETYGKQLVKMWPENTDPLKFVYEDIAIATYLLLLWAGKPKQRFVDLGCGNGLLVHILNCEGHLGVGYDLRPRKIWSLYPPSTKLEVRTIIPSSETVFPDADWLIGNHSDELTVWIPVMAARSSYSCNFFLLPCCPYEFDGKKYCRANTSISQYCDFLTYVETVCKECGVVTEKDKLRIPSTKRICFVSQKRTYLESEWESFLDKLQMFIDSKCGLYDDGSNQELWCPQFKARGEEKVRNCTQIASDIQESIVNLVAEQLLAKRRTSVEGWNYGGVLDIGSLAKMVPTENLKKLKKECGGLQTLLKNHHYIFKVQSGKVEFRIPTEKLKTDGINWKRKPCWFYHYHPNSCPLTEDKCSFVHSS